MVTCLQAYPKINLDAYTHHIIIIPPSSCNQAGYGTLDCVDTAYPDGPLKRQGPCTLWIDPAKARWADGMDLLLHELGHGLGMRHSSYGGNAYGECLGARVVSAPVWCCT